MEDPTIREVTLEKFKLVAVQYLTPELLEHFGEPAQIEFSEHVSFMFDEIALRIVQKVWGREVDRVEHQWPANWWEAFKERWMPKWAKDRWPIQYSTCTLIAQEMYPKVAMPEREHSIVLHKMIE
jgi:hypothetical protein